MSIRFKLMIGKVVLGFIVAAYQIMSRLMMIYASKRWEVLHLRIPS